MQSPAERRPDTLVPLLWKNDSNDLFVPSEQPIKVSVLTSTVSNEATAVSSHTDAGDKEELETRVADEQSSVDVL